MEYRSKQPEPAWRSRFDWMIATGSFLASLLLGTAFSNLLNGVPINENMIYTGNFFTLLNPYTLLGGLTITSVFLLHGANFLVLKLEAGELKDRAVNASKKIWIVASVLYLALGIYTYINNFWNKEIIDPGIIPIVAVAVLLLTGTFINRKREGWAFISTGLNIILTQVAFYMMMFPNVMVSSTDSAYSLTIYNASSSAYTLGVMSIVALIFVPIILMYQAWTYWMFAKRVKVDKKTLVY